MSRRTKAKDRIEELEIDLTPMIDVTFQLLIFFICTLKFKTLEGKLETELPKDVGVNAAPVVRELLLAQCIATVHRDGHDIGRAIGQPDPSTGVRDLHHMPREVARRVRHVLVCGGNAAGCCVVVGSKVSRDAATIGCIEKLTERATPVEVEN